MRVFIYSFIVRIVDSSNEIIKACLSTMVFIHSSIRQRGDQYCIYYYIMFFGTIIYITIAVSVLRVTLQKNDVEFSAAINHMQ